MLLHLVDDEKITNRIISSFEEALPRQNMFICFPNENYQTVKPSHNVIIYNGEKEFRLPNIENVNKVLIHYLHEGKTKFIEKFIPNNIPCYWFIWGGDMYNNILTIRGYDIYYDKFFFSRRQKVSFFLNHYGLYHTYFPILSFIKKRINFFVTTCYEFEIIKKYIGSYINGKLLDKGFFYYPIDEILGKELVGKDAKGNIILLGNSASFTNNHKYAIKYLSKLGLGDKKVVAPLSYAGTETYINQVCDYGKEKLKDKFTPLRTFLPLNEYNKLMTQAEVCVYGNWRQEAFGNILVALYLGAKVFLSKRSPLIALFKDMGIKIYILEKAKHNDLITPLSTKDKERNRNIIGTTYTKEKQKSIIKIIWG